MSVVNLARRSAAEDHVTPAMLVARAKAIAPTLVPLQAEVEKRTFYSQETHELLKEAGFYRILTPKRYGGYEFGIDTFFKVTMEISAGCSSTGWMLSLGSGHALQVASVFDEAIQSEVFSDPDFVAPVVQKVSGTATRRADGDWEISGVFPYCSGSPYSQWFIGRAANADGSGAVTFLAPRSSYTRLDDWGGQLGMNGSGSHSLKMEQAVLASRFVFPGMDLMMIDVTKGSPGSRLHGNPMYAGSAGSFFLGGAACMLIGIAKNGLGAYETLMQKNTTFGPPGPRTRDAFFQSWYGTAVGKIMSAEAIVMKMAEYWTDAARDGAFTHEMDLELMAMSREASDLAWDSMQQIIFRTAGTSALVDGARMQRAWRDMSTARSHNGIVFFHEAAKGMLARAHFGIH